MKRTSARSASGGDAAGHLYPATVMHRRLVAPLYRFRYRIFYLLVDIDRLDELDRGLRWFSHNRFNLLSLRDSDYGHGESAQSAGVLRRWATEALASAGLELDGRIHLLTLPRILGHAFNPISLWYCENAAGELRAVIAEVRNTFGEKHSYLLRAPASASAALAASTEAGDAYEWVQEVEKCFHVSPFFDLTGRYRFTLGLPGERLAVAIHETREGLPIFDASLQGSRHALTDQHLLRQVAAMPWMSLKVVVGIHWQALKIWLRGGVYHPKPAPPTQAIS